MASKINKGEILAKFFDDGEYTALFADGAVSAACGYAAGQQAYAVYQNGEAVTVKDVEKNIKVLEMAAQTGCPVVTFYNSVGAKLAEGLDVLTANAKLNAQIAKVSGVIPQVAVVLGVCGGTSALSAANADVCIMAEGAELFFTAPFTSAAKGDKVADAGSAAAAAKAGVASIVAADAAEAAEKAAHIVGLLPANNLTGPAIFEFGAAHCCSGCRCRACQGCCRCGGQGQHRGAVCRLWQVGLHRICHRRRQRRGRCGYRQEPVPQLRGQDCPLCAPVRRLQRAGGHRCGHRGLCAQRER